MSKKIRAFIGYLKVLVNGETLGGGFYRFLSVHACFLVFYGLPHVFINTMLLGQTGDVKVVVMYNATFFLGSAAAMLLAAGLLQRTDSGVTAVLGILGYNVLYLLLIVLGDNASRWHLWLGLLAGLADGCYWLSYGHLLSDSTDLSNRDSGLAIVNICANVVNLTIPLLAGFIIDAVGGTRAIWRCSGCRLPCPPSPVRWRCGCPSAVWRARIRWTIPARCAPLDATGICCTAWLRRAAKG